MRHNTQDSATTNFMLSEYEDFYQNIMHLENELFAHLSFYTTLLLGIVTVSIAIVKLGEDGSSLLAPTRMLPLLAPLFLLFAVVGRFELRMTTELRIRKMKFIEGLTQIRQYFVDKDNCIAHYLMLPVGLHKAPPYLRVRSKDWYQVIYFSLMNGLAVFIAWILLLPPVIAALIGAVHILVTRILAIIVVPAPVTEIVSILFGRLLATGLVVAWLLVGALLFWLISWVLSYRSVMDFCEDYDKKRQEIMKRPSEYDLFERAVPQSWVRRSFGDWICWIEQRRATDERHCN